jgi:hypothetical protein
VATRKQIGQARQAIGSRSRSPPAKVVSIPLMVANLARHLANGTLQAGDINGFTDIEALANHHSSRDADSAHRAGGHELARYDGDGSQRWDSPHRDHQADPMASLA